MTNEFVRERDIDHATRELPSDTELGGYTIRVTSDGYELVFQAHGVRTKTLGTYALVTDLINAAQEHFVQL